ITSALDDETALDNGPIAGHSLFTGALIEALTGGIATAADAVTGSELATWVRGRVRSYPAAHQTPDFGAFDHDERGEIPIPLPRRADHGSLAGAPGVATQSPGEPARVMIDPVRSHRDATSAAATTWLRTRPRRRPDRSRLWVLELERDWVFLVVS